MQCRGSESGRIQIFDMVVSGIVNFSASGSGSETRSELLHNFIILKEPRKVIKVCNSALTFTTVSIFSTGNVLTCSSVRADPEPERLQGRVGPHISFADRQRVDADLGRNLYFDTASHLSGSGSYPDQGKLICGKLLVYMIQG
jgi:hypothetical protein